MKRVFAIFLASLLIFNMLGGIVIFMIFKSPLGNSPIQRSRFSDKVEITILRLSANPDHSDTEYRFLDKHELKFNGKMYDIITKVRTEDSLFVYCIEDETESNILNAITILFKETDNESPAGKVMTISLKNIIQEGLPSGANVFPIFNRAENFKNIQAAKLFSFPPEILTPPPRA